MGLDIKEMDHPLPEFSVRQLQNDAKGDKTVTPKQSRFVANVFSMRKRSYDDLVTRHPQAALLYDDPDDGECITVGSGFELKQRLDEVNSLQPAGGKEAACASSSRDEFHINGSEDVCQTWADRFDTERQRHERYRQTRQENVQSQAERQSRKKTPVEVEQHGIKARLADAEANSNDQRSSTPTNGAARAASLKNSRSPEQLKNLLCIDSGGRSATKLPTTSNSYSGSPTATDAPKTQETDEAWLADVSTAEERYNEVRADIAKHQSRWASYNSVNTSVVQPLPPQHKLEPDTGKANDQPLLSLLEAELAKMTNSLRDGHARLLEADSRPGSDRLGKLGVSQHTDPIDHVPQTQVAQDYLKSLLAGIGDLASCIRRKDPKLAQRIEATGQVVHGNLNTLLQTGDGTVESVHKLVESAVQVSPRLHHDANDVSTASQHPQPPQAYGAVTTGFLKWQRGNADEKHELSCTDGCKAGTYDCPVRSHVQDLARKVYRSESRPDTMRRSAPSTTPLRHDPKSSRLPPITAFGDLEKCSFQADQVLAKRYIFYNSMWGPGKEQYLIRWLGHGPEHDIWYDAENLGGCKGLIEQFERAIDSEEACHFAFSRPQIHSIHLRTAGDRMVASPKWKECKKMADHRRFHTDEQYRQKKLSDLCGVQRHQENEANAFKEAFKASVGVASASSREDFQNRANSLKSISPLTLGHQSPWHPMSSAEAVHRASSPTVAAKRYPAIASFEAAHAERATEKRRSVPQPLKHSLVPHALDFPRIAGPRQIGDDATRFSTPRDKSVRFDLTDPWVEKKKAQEQWQAKQQLEQSHYDASTLHPAKTEDKKPVKGSSPSSPPLSTHNTFQSPNRGESSGEAHTVHPTVRRAMSLNSGMKHVRNLLGTSSISGKEEDSYTICRGSPKWPLKCEDAPLAEHMQESHPTLRRVESAKFASKENCKWKAQWHETANTYHNYEGKSWPFPDLHNNDVKTDDENDVAAVPPPAPHSTSVHGFDKGLNSRILKDPALKPQYAPLSEDLQPYPAALGTSTPTSTEAQHPVATSPSAFQALKQSTSPPPPQPSPNHAHPMVAVTASIKAPRDRIKMTVSRLTEMGFSRTEAHTVSESVDGNLDQALDMLHEDQKARQTGFDVNT